MILGIFLPFNGMKEDRPGELAPMPRPYKYVFSLFVFDSYKKIPVKDFAFLRKKKS